LEKWEMIVRVSYLEKAVGEIIVGGKAAILTPLQKGGARRPFQGKSMIFSGFLG
jgi:hypothetical protein